MTAPAWLGGHVGLKRLVKRTAGWAAVMADSIQAGFAGGTASVLVYHRVAPIRRIDPFTDDWNVPPDVLDRQIRALVDIADIVPVRDLPGRLTAAEGHGRPLVAITFDDGYLGVRKHVLPILERYGVPASVFLVTAFVDRTEPMPFDGWAQRCAIGEPVEAWQPLSWQDVDACAASGLITFGSHSARHLNARRCSAAQLEEEVGCARAVLLERVGADHAEGFAYPYGCSRLGQVTDSYVAAVQAAGHRFALTTDLGLVRADSNPFTLPRLEAHVVDSPAVLRAKARGALSPYRVTDQLRRAERFG